MRCGCQQIAKSSGSPTGQGMGRYLLISAKNSSPELNIFTVIEPQLFLSQTRMEYIS